MHLNIWQVLFIALLQGITELFPISSVGHTVIIPGLLGWNNIIGNDNFIPFLAALHLGTTVALLLYFWRDWLQVLRSLFTSIKTGEVRRGTDEWTSWLIIIGCIPLGLLGVFLEKQLKQVFASPLIAATFLIVNGSFLMLGEGLRRRSEQRFAGLSPKAREAHFRPLSALSWKEALLVGCVQTLSLIPGFSRSGMAIVGGLGVRLTHEDAARYSFLLGTPIIAAAGLLEVPSLFGESSSTLLIIGIGMVATGIAAFISTKFLMKYFETGRLSPFAYYCWGGGAVSLALFYFVLHLGR